MSHPRRRANSRGRTTYVDPLFKELICELKPNDNVAVAPVCEHGKVHGPCDIYLIETIENRPDGTTRIEGTLVVGDSAHHGQNDVRYVLVLSVGCSGQGFIVAFPGVVMHYAANGGQPLDCCNSAVMRARMGRV